MWRELGMKIDTERDQKRFWKEIGGMIERKKGDRVQVLKDENGVELRTRKEMKEAYRRQVIRTFKKGEEENAEFCQKTDRKVEEWARTNREKLLLKVRKGYEDCLEIKYNLIKNITSVKEKAPGSSGITRKHIQTCLVPMLRSLQLVSLLVASRELGRSPK